MGEDSSGIASYSAVLIPVHNEAATLAFVLDSVRGHFGGPVLVIDDGSTDSTSQILSCFEWVDVIRHSNNLGYGKALATAFAWAAEKGLDSVVTMDCDGQHEPARIPEFLAELSQGADIISGSRYLPESVATGEAPTSRQEINAKVSSHNRSDAVEPLGCILRIQGLQDGLDSGCRVAGVWVRFPARTLGPSIC